MNNNNRHIIAHMLGWKLSEITKKLDDIKNAGFDGVQVSPLQGCKDDNNHEFWIYYQPLSMSLVGSKQIGYREDLIELCKEAKKRDIFVSVDLVLRHTAGVNSGELIPHEKVDKILTDNPYFWTHAENTTDYWDRFKSTNYAFGMPMLDYNNWDLQDLYIKYIQDLKNCGVSSLRIDMAKHLSLPEEDSVFWTRVFDRFKDMFVYAECLECETDLLDKYAKYVDVITDYRMPSDRSKAVIFIESHDTYWTFKSTTKMSDNQILDEYEYLMKTNRDSHILFFVRPFNDTFISDRMKYINNTYR